MLKLKRIGQIGVPVLMFIAVPLVLFFCSKAGKNVYKSLPYVGEKQLDKAGDTIYYTTAPWQALNEDSQRVTDAILKDKITVVDFIFTRCPSICKDLTTNLKTIQEDGKTRKDFQILSVSIDPKYDQPTVLKKYAAKNGINISKWHLLNAGNNTDSLVRKFLIPRSEQSPDGDPLKLRHSGIVLLLDKQGYIRGTYNGVDPEEIKRLGEDIYMLIYSYDKR
ncbi:MAG: SCO family protein [Bacteroidota bacterium]|nr:SCO family protein [Bacteroidota bacterium]